LTVSIKAKGDEIRRWGRTDSSGSEIPPSGVGFVPQTLCRCHSYSCAVSRAARCRVEHVLSLMVSMQCGK